MTRLALVILLASLAPAEATPLIEPIDNAPLSGMITFPSAAVQDTIHIPYAIPVSRAELLAQPPRPVVYFLHGYIREEGAGVMEQIQWSVQALRHMHSSDNLQEQFPDSFEPYQVPPSIHP